MFSSGGGACRGKRKVEDEERGWLPTVDQGKIKPRPQISTLPMSQLRHAPFAPLRLDIDEALDDRANVSLVESG